MQPLEYRTMDKTDWGEGAWQSEPDKRQWRDEATGLPCLIVRNRSGTLCGYVGVPVGHSAHGQGYEDVDVEVHGGLTYADACSHGDQSHSICHIPQPGEPDDVWWLGFDCAHAGDYRPAHAKFGAIFQQHDWETYKDIAYVEGEVRSLAAQLVAL